VGLLTIGVMLAALGLGMKQITDTNNIAKITNLVSHPTRAES
jgi:hypothetical protein